MTDAEEEKTKRPPVSYAVEGGGVVAQCKGCGVEAWKPNRLDAERWARDDHKTCRADQVKLHHRLTQARLPAYARTRLA